MKKTALVRGMALTLCLALLSACGLSEEAPAAQPVEAPVAEAREFALSAEAEWDAGEAPLILAADSPEADPAEETAEETAVEEAPAEEAPATPSLPKLKKKRFSKTKSVKSTTYKSVNLVRQKGFKGVFATVSGTLKLKNVQIEGTPAREVNLINAFELGPTGSIVVSDDAALSTDVSAFSFNKGDSRKLKLTYKGKSVSAKKAKWKSSDSKIAKVSKSGKITALKKGKAKITVSYKGKTVTCRVIVTDIIEVEAIEIKTPSLTLSKNRTAKLKVRFTPSKATDRTVKWKSSDKSVVTVDRKGKLTGVSAGTATITATSANGKTSRCTVSVKDVPLKGVEFSQLYVTMNPGDTFKAKANLQPSDSSYTELRYKSSNKSVATVDKTTGKIKAKKCGTTTITVTSKHDSSIKNTCKVCVIKPTAKRMAGLVIGINPGHQIKTIGKLYPLAPGSSKMGKGVKTGACGRWTRVNEYETTLQVGLKLAKRLTKLGATVVITRETNDVMLTNIDRAQMLNKAGVDVALQLHCDSIDSPRAEGCSAFYRTTGDWVEESRALAKALTDAISAKTGCVNNGAKVYNDYMSLNWSTTPSVLIEMGYISNQKEDRLLASDSYRNKMAKGIVNGLCAYFGR